MDWVCVPARRCLLDSNMGQIQRHLGSKTDIACRQCSVLSGIADSRTQYQCQDVACRTGYPGYRWRRSDHPLQHLYQRSVQHEVRGPTDIVEVQNIIRYADTNLAENEGSISE